MRNNEASITLKRFRWCLVVVFTFALGYLTARTHNQPAAGYLPPEFDPLAFGLHGKFADIAINDVSFSEATSQLATIYQRSIRLIGIDLDEIDQHKLTLKLQHVDLEAAIERLCSASQEKIGHTLQWDINAGEIVVGNIGECVHTRLYDVKPAMLCLITHWEHRPREPQPWYRIFFPDYRQGAYMNNSAEDFADELKKAVTDIIEPTHWKDNGGELGSISTLTGNLWLVSTTTRNHNRLRGFLNDCAKIPLNLSSNDRFTPRNASPSTVPGESHAK